MILVYTLPLSNKNSFFFHISNDAEQFRFKGSSKNNFNTNEFYL